MIFYIFALEIFLVVLVALVTKREVTYASIATNGIIVMMAGGTILYDQRPIGFFLLGYAALLMAGGVREYIEKVELMREEWFGKLLKAVGNYAIVAAILTAVLIREYILPLL